MNGDGSGLEFTWVGAIRTFSRFGIIDDGLAVDFGRDFISLNDDIEVKPFAIFDIGFFGVLNAVHGGRPSPVGVRIIHLNLIALFRPIFFKESGTHIKSRIGTRIGFHAGVHFEISEIKSFVEQVTAGAFDDEFTASDAEGIRVFASVLGV